MVGHTQVDKINLNNGHNIIPVDVGLHRKLEYVVFTEGVPEVHEAQLASAV